MFAKNRMQGIYSLHPVFPFSILFDYFLIVTLSSFQISSTYSWIVLSDVNLPVHATFKIALFAQADSFLYAFSTRFWASA